VPATTDTSKTGTNVQATNKTTTGQEGSNSTLTPTTLQNTAKAGEEKNTTEEVFAIALTGEAPTSGLTEATDKTWKDQISAIVTNKCGKCHAAGNKSPEITSYAMALQVALKISTAIVFHKHPDDELDDLQTEQFKNWATELVKAGIKQETTTAEAKATTTTPTSPATAKDATGTDATTAANKSAAADAPSELMTPSAMSSADSTANPCQ
jgi:hypothetical protein